ncbi:hypothetical protein HDU76_013244, partial [Blyttiomyces sp. JEL0837]
MSSSTSITSTIPTTTTTTTTTDPSKPAMASAPSSPSSPITPQESSVSKPVSQQPLPSPLATTTTNSPATHPPSAVPLQPQQLYYQPQPQYVMQPNGTLVPMQQVQLVQVQPVRNIMSPVPAQKKQTVPRT